MRYITLNRSVVLVLSLINAHITSNWWETWLKVVLFHRSVCYDCIIEPFEGRFNTMDAIWPSTSSEPSDEALRCFIAVRYPKISITSGLHRDHRVLFHDYDSFESHIPTRGQLRFRRNYLIETWCDALQRWHVICYIHCRCRQKMNRLALEMLIFGSFLFSGY